MKVEAVQIEPLLYSAKQTAALLGISGRHFESLLSAGRVPQPIRSLGKRRLWQRKVVESFVDCGCKITEPFEDKSNG